MATLYIGCAALNPFLLLCAANILVRYLGEEGEKTPIRAAISMCNPFNLVRQFCGTTLTHFAWCCTSSNPAGPPKQSFPDRSLDRLRVSDVMQAGRIFVELKDMLELQECSAAMKLYASHTQKRQALQGACS